MLCSVDIRCANFSNFPMVTPMLLPISAALLANSDLLGFPSGLPFAAAFCESVRRDCLCAPTFDEACRRCTCVRTERNSLVRSCIEETAIASDGRWSESQGKDGRIWGRTGAFSAGRGSLFAFGSQDGLELFYSRGCGIKKERVKECARGSLIYYRCKRGS
jgi:hypothetical protein